jgi:hypothetical protein
VLDGRLGQARALDGKVAQIFAAATTVVFGLAGATHDLKAPGGVLIAALVFYGLTLLGSIAGLWPVDVRNGLLIAALSRGHAFPHGRNRTAL